MRRSDARIEGTPEGEAKISGGAGGGSEKSREDRENKRVCGCCYLKGLDKVSMTDSVRSEHNPMPRVRHGCQIVGGRADGFRGYTIRFGQGEHTHTHTHQGANAHRHVAHTRVGRQSYQRALINTNELDFCNLIAHCPQATATFHHIRPFNLSKNDFFGGIKIAGMIFFRCPPPHCHSSPLTATGTDAMSPKRLPKHKSSLFLTSCLSVCCIFRRRGTAR